MRWFRRKRFELPEWARQLETHDRMLDFLDEVREAIGVRKQSFDVEQAKTGQLTIDDRVLELAPLARRCARLRTFEWAEELIGGLRRQGFSDLTKKRKRPFEKPRSEPALPGANTHEVWADGKLVSSVDFDTDPFERIAPFVKLQLFSPESRGAFEALDQDRLVFEELCPRLWAALMLDFGHSSETVSQGMLRRWKMPRERVWDEAIRNVAAQPRMVQVSDQGALVMVGNGNFIAALAVGTGRSTMLGPGCAMYVLVPNWHAIVFFDGRASPDRARDHLTELGRTLFDYEDPVSPDIFRIEHGLWTRLEA